jgi:hypothetical protein
VSGSPPRLKSAIWVQALLRRCSVEGKFGAVLHKGAEEAGAVFVVINHLDGTYDFLGPPPGSSTNADGEKIFIREVAAATDWLQISEKIDRKKKSDTDIWVVEIEDRVGLAGITLASI